MALDLLPHRLPTLEPVKAALSAALSADLGAALDYVEQLAESEGRAVLTLPRPAAIRTVTVNDYAEVTAWPTITIESGGMEPREGGEQTVNGMARGHIDVFAWLQGAIRDLDTLLDRYGAAVWLVVLNHDPLGGCELSGDPPSIAPDPTGGSGNRRCVQVGFDVFMRV